MIKKEHQDHDNKEEHLTPIDFEKLAQGFGEWSDLSPITIDFQMWN